MLLETVTVFGLINVCSYSVFRSNDRPDLCRERLGTVFKGIYPSRREQALSDQKVGGEVCLMKGDKMANPLC